MPMAGLPAVAGDLVQRLRQGGVPDGYILHTGPNLGRRLTEKARRRSASPLRQ